MILPKKIATARFFKDGEFNMSGLRLAFMGTPEFALPSLASLVKARYEIAAVYTQPPRPAGRGQKERFSPVHTWAADNGLSVRTPKSLLEKNEQAAFAALDVDMAVVAAYGKILPKSILNAPRLGCINVHASLLPRWRGAAPIQRAILAGDTETGISIMLMEESLDTGPVLCIKKMRIDAATNAGDLHDSLAVLGGRMICDALQGYAGQLIQPTSQDHAIATYAKKVEKVEARINWSAPALSVMRQVNAFSPRPGAWSRLGMERIKILAAHTETGLGESGAVLDDNLLVACGDTALRLTRLQREGKRPVDAAEFLKGRAVKRGDVFG
tara:strand:+ start:21175 stop:22155 length:981 start_codon:yes stop_codon:yes gene_type:complete